MKRVLVTGAANIGKAGVATIVYKWGQEFDSNVLVYDYLMQRGLPDQEYLEAIKKKGGRTFTIKTGKRGILAVIKWVEKIIRENKYEIIHINSDSAYIAAAYIYAAKKANIRHIYVHSHCTQIDDKNRVRRGFRILMHKITTPYVCKNTELYLACSKLAGYWMFGKDRVESARYKTIYNGVAVKPYLFQQQVRDEYRKMLHLDEKFILGNVGRFSYQKNHEFLIEVFDALAKRNFVAVLVLVGTGEMENKLHTLVKKKGIKDKVIFLGTRNDIPSLLSMFDVLVMPSRFEGLPVTMVEAQMADLPCVVSSNITKEAQFTDAVQYVDGYEIDKWVMSIEKYSIRQRVCRAEEKYNSNFNIKNAALELEQVLLG